MCDTVCVRWADRGVTASRRQVTLPPRMASMPLNSLGRRKRARSADHGRLYQQSSERRSTGLSRPAVSEAERTARACRASALAPGMRSAKRSMARTMGTPFRSVSAMARYEAHDGDVLMTQGVCRRFWRKSNPVPRRPPYSISKTEIRLPELAMMCSTCVEKSTTLIRGSLPTFRSTVRRTAGSSRAANGLGDGLRDGTYQLASLASRHLIGRAWGRTQMRQ